MPYHNCSLTLKVKYSLARRRRRCLLLARLWLAWCGRRRPDANANANSEERKKRKRGWIKFCFWAQTNKSKIEMGGGEIAKKAVEESGRVGERGGERASGAGES